MEKIKIAIIGIGNCTSSLVQGIEFYKNKSEKDAIGLMHWDIGGVICLVILKWLLLSILTKEK